MAMATRSSSRLRSQTNKQKSLETPLNLKSARNKKQEIQLSDSTSTSDKLGSSESNEHEAVTAYLRIRPQLDAAAPTKPYLTALSETTVLMVDNVNESNRRARGTSTETEYKFTHVFPPTTKQEEFFTKTTLPLISSVLRGQNALLFAYGVTNSGKTYSIQGGSGEDEAGILPRSLDLIFRSIRGHESKDHFKPIRLGEVEKLSKNAYESYMAESADLFQMREPDFLSKLIDPQTDSASITTDASVTVEEGFDYSIWVSYAEIYNERVYDLLGKQDAFGKLQKTTSSFLSSASRPTFASRNRTDACTPDRYSIRRKALSLKSDGEGGKYIAGLREVRIQSVEEGKKILKLGQLNRRVFGTLANQASSRSHAIFTTKVLRIPKKQVARVSQSVTVSRLSIVDLAGSERTKLTQTSGERLKEAGSINRSLMVLGQCLEVLRTNQKRSANCAVTSPKLVVPFRDSKLTEVFQDFFAGSGRAGMIVNVNPYDTGFDENSQVMKFSAIAREVSTVIAKPNAAGRRRTVRLSLADKSYDALFDILEEIDTEEDDTPINPLVDSLFDEVEKLRKRLHESEERASRIEMEVREEVMKDMMAQMLAMEESYAQRLRSELEHNERKLDLKIDLLYHGGHLQSSNDRSRASTSSDTSLHSPSAQSDCHSVRLRYQEERSSCHLKHSDYSMNQSQSYGEQRSNDLGLFEHDDRSATETEGTDSSADASDVDEVDGGPSESFEDEEYLPSDALSTVNAMGTSASGGSEDSIDFLSPSKKESVYQIDSVSRLGDEVGKLSFSTNI